MVTSIRRRPIAAWGALVWFAVVAAGCSGDDSAVAGDAAGALGDGSLGVVEVNEDNIVFTYTP